MTVCKVRGITLNYMDLQIVNFNVIREMVLKGAFDRVNVHTEKIKSKRKGQTEGGVPV
jgi:hypothetical protein